MHDLYQAATQGLLGLGQARAQLGYDSFTSMRLARAEQLRALTGIAPTTEEKWLEWLDDEWLMQMDVNDWLKDWDA